MTDPSAAREPALPPRRVAPGAVPREPPPVVEVVVQQHAEEAAHLRHMRSRLVRAPHAGLAQLARLDERIAAHLDGLAVAGRHGSARCLAALAQPGAGEVFALTVRALQSRDDALLAHVLALVPVLPAAARGAASALGWVPAADLHGTVRDLLASAEPAQRVLGLTACRMHRVDPGPALGAALEDPQPEVRAAAWRVAGELGLTGRLAQARRAITDDHPDVVLHAARAACLLGDRGASLRVLDAASQQHAAPGADAALALALAAHPFAGAGELARRLSQAAQAHPADRVRQRRLIHALGWLGDARFVPWLIDRMAEPPWARAAGEAFGCITGADLADDDLEAPQPPAAADDEGDPDPDSERDGDDTVDDDDDDSLPWPDPQKAQAWWSRQTAQHAAAQDGQRLFEGRPPTPDRALQCLRQGTQRRRAQAAHWRCVLQPGQPLFPVAAPAPRQRRWLAETGA